jgi:hypothetical protein
MAGILDSYFMKPGSGIFGGLLDDPAGVWRAPQPEPANGGYPSGGPPAGFAAANAGLPPQLASFLGLDVASPMFTSLSAPKEALPGNSQSPPVAALSAANVMTPPIASAGRAAQTSGGLGTLDMSSTAPDAADGKAAPADDASGNDFLSRLGQGLHDNSSMLMALGGGMMTGGLGKGFQAGADAAVADGKRQSDDAGRNTTLRALLQARVPFAVAQAAAANPALLKAISARVFR